MEFQNLKGDFISNLYETSKSTKQGSAVLGKQQENIDVYHLDKIKDWFCDMYRNGEKICSCDAYYQDGNNCLVIEFKNTHHLRMKEFISEITVKFIDTHFLLAETFFGNRKVSKISSTVDVRLVYNDGLEYGKGIQNLSSALNNMTPMRGNTSRKSIEKQVYSNENEYERDVNKIKAMFQSDFYKSVEFVDKKDFMVDYIESSYFSTLN